MKKLFPTVFVAAMVLLLAVGGRAAESNSKIQNSNRVEGIVVPDNVYDRQPFSFAVPQDTGEGVNIQTVEGVVVHATSTDHYGRVFLAAGLPAGAYLISRSSQPLGKIEIKQRASDALQHASQPMQVQNLPQALKLSDPFSLSGHGFSPNYGDMQVSLAGSGNTESLIVLAATEDQLKLAPVQQLRPGTAHLRVTNHATGQSTDAYDLLLYDIQGNLVRRTLKSGGDETQLVIKTKPENIPLPVKVNVVSGPVDFGKGLKETGGVTSNGEAIFPVHPEHGAGPFQLTWELAPVAMEIARLDAGENNNPTGSKPSHPATPDVTQPPENPPHPPSPPSAPPGQDHGDCHCTVGAGGGTDKLKASVADRPSPEDIRASQDWWYRRKAPVTDYLGSVKFNFNILNATVEVLGAETRAIVVKRNTTITASGAAKYSFETFWKNQDGNYVPRNNEVDRHTCNCPVDTVQFRGTSQEFLVEIHASRAGVDTRIPDQMQIDVDIADTIDPCGFVHHLTRSFILKFEDKSGVKMLQSVEEMP